MKLLITTTRVRFILTGAKNEKDAADILRRHRIRYTFSTAGGILHIRIPARAGVITVTRTASKSAPLRVAAAAPASVAPYPYPVPAWTWDD